ncbi:hypothetical protein P4S64_09690 [Vibrio sp. M60_M31a]
MALLKPLIEEQLSALVEQQRTRPHLRHQQHQSSKSLAQYARRVLICSEMLSKEAGSITGSSNGTESA